ncbi:MAG TPA: M56 family metallopeptidase [Blastocatellia bacterium]|nr:M56 family metallopeptidase [Blastocatellia bacterium]
MNSLEMLLTKPLFQALGWALVHFIWQGALVALLYAGLATLLRRRAANLRYSVACAAMLLMLALPVATVLFIERSSSQADSSASRTASPSEAAATILIDGHRQALTNEVSAPTSGAYVSQAVPTAQSRTPVEAAAPASPSAWRLWAKERFAGLIPWLVAVWFAGVLFLSLRFLGGLVITRRLKRLQTSPLLEQWQTKLAALCEQLRVSRPVRLCESVLVEVPTVIGWLRPVILLPVSALTGLSPAQLEALLAHELGHIKRYDYLVNLLQTAVETLLFYHPAVWWLSSQIRQEREHCCDDLAVATCGNVLVYARALAELEQLRGVAPQLAVAASGGVLLRRIQRLVGNPARPSHRFESWLAGVIALATAGCLLAGAQTTMLSGGTTSAAADASSAAASQTANGNASRAAQVADQKASDSPRDALTKEGEGESDAAESPAAADDAPESQAANQPDQQSEPGGDFVSGLAAAGYTNLSVDELVTLRFHGVTPAFVREMNALFNQKLSVDKLIAFKIHGVTPQFLSEMKAAGLSNLSADDLVAFRIHGVTPQVVAEWKAAGYDHLSEDELVAFSIHGVTPAFVQEMKGLGFDHLSPGDLVAFRIHGVTPAFVQAMRGYVRGDLSEGDLVAFRIHGVSPEFVKAMEAAGYANLSAGDLVAFRIHGVSADFVKSLQALGFKPSAEQLVALRIHGVTPEYVESVKSRGFRDATLEQVIELRRLNIVPGQRKN